MILSPKDREEWLQANAELISSLFIKKYQDGAKEHEGDLGWVPIDKLVDEMVNEALDQLAYALEIKRRLNRVSEPEVDRMIKAINNGKWI
jgi:hypothetical protein